MLVDILHKENVIVQRLTSLHNPLQKYTVGEFDIEYINPSYSPRDLIGFFGNKIVEAYTKVPRFFGNTMFRDILKEYYLYGSRLGHSCL